MDVGVVMCTSGGCGCLWVGVQIVKLVLSP